MDDADIYANVSKGKLKLKSDSEVMKKKKKNKKISQKKIQRVMDEHDTKIESEANTEESSEFESKSTIRQLTKAEISFKHMQEKMQKKRILDKASFTHKQRVEKFNEHLDGLTEHFDIPKVSWTK